MPAQRVLPTKERKRYDKPCLLDAKERKSFFTLNDDGVRITSGIKSDINKVGFILQYGYFQATRMFFDPEKYYKSDISYLKEMLSITTPLDLMEYERTTRWRHQKQILDIFAWKMFGKIERKELYDYSIQLTRNTLNSKKIFDRSIGFLLDNRIEVPAYSTMAEIISDTLNEREQKNTAVICQYFPVAGNLCISELLAEDDEDRDLDKIQRHKYRLSFFKKITKESSYSATAENLERLQKIKIFFTIFEDLVVKLDLNLDGFKYYADYVSKCRVSQLRRMSDEKRRLFLVSYIYVKYLELNDLLIGYLLKATQTSTNSVDRAYQDSSAQKRDKDAHVTKSVLQDVMEVVFPLQNRVHEILISDNLSYEDKVKTALKAYEQETKRVDDAKENIIDHYNDTTEGLEGVDRYCIMENNSIKLQRRVSSIIIALDFDYLCCDQFLESAIRFYKISKGLIDKNSPQQFLTPKERKMIYRLNGTFRISLYKFLLFQHVSKSIKAGSLNICHSIRYKRFENYLIPENEWLTQRDHLLNVAGLEHIVDFDKMIEDLSQTMNQKYETVNHRIEIGDNDHITFRDDGRYVLKTMAILNNEKNRFSDVFPSSLNVNITEILSSVNNQTNFTDCFTHYTNKSVKDRPNHESFIATLIALGCGVGLGKMKQISKNIKDNIERTATHFISPDNLMEANNEILRVISNLPISKIYHSDDVIRTSSDGAKFGVLIDSIDSNHSFKYFGKGSGVSVYTFIDQSHKMFYSIVINASEREAGYVLDGLIQNDIVNSDVHSTDTHGCSEVVFASMHLLAFKFAPRIKRMNRQNIYSFESPKKYQRLGYKILPDDKINVELIKRHWDMILRFITTISLKRSIPSDLFRRLNSYSADSPFYQALKEFGRIIKTLHILEYIDSHSLRQGIEKQLNKVESAQKFSRGVMASGKYEFSSNIREEQLLIEGAKRLIQNAVLCWNYFYVSQMLRKEKCQYEASKIKKIIKNGSPITWRHVNFIGIYDFNPELLRCRWNFDLQDLKCLKL